MADGLDAFVAGVCTQDTRKRISTHGEIVAYLRDPANPTSCDELDRIVDGLTAWVNSSNYKISLNGLEVISLLIDRVGEDFKHHVHTVLPAIVDRLGDNKDQVREAAKEVLLKLMVPASSPQFVFDRMMGAFTHKLWRVRESALICLQKTLNHYGASRLSLSKIVNVIVKLLEDQSGPVRDEAVNTLVEIYRHVGERVRNDLSKKDISPARLNAVYMKMDECRREGNMLPTADAPRSAGDDVDFARPGPGAPRAAVGGSAAPGRRISSAPVRGRLSSLPNTKASAAAAQGAVDEESFIRAFEDVPKVNLFSARELTEHVTRIREMLESGNADWEKRCESLKAVRALLISGAADYDEFPTILRSLELSFQTSTKDLRSQVVREACISIAYMSQLLGNKFDHFAEAVLLNLINLIPNSAKIMATAGLVAIRFIIQYTHHPRLVPIITNNVTSKSNIIRRQCCEFVEQLLHTWPTHMLERHIAALQEAIKKALSDADSEARAHARKAFWGFSHHFKDQADSLMHSLDLSKQKQLHGEMSGSSSSTSLDTAGASRPRTAGAATGGRARSMSTERSGQNQGYIRSVATAGGSQARRLPVSNSTSSYKHASPKIDTGLVRSSSAVDLADGSSHSGHTPRMGVSSRLPQSNYSSLPRQKKNPSNVLSPERSRPRSRIGVSQSQPSSRSGSPSSRLSYLTHVTTGGGSAAQGSHTAGAGSSSAGRPRRKSGIPRSQGASREGSPSRITYGRERKYSAGSVPVSRTLNHPQRVKTGSGGGVLAQRVLQPGSEAETALQDALKLPGRKRFESYDSADDASETSSVCSERSFSSYGRTSEDVSEILSNMSSASWADRKEGLVALQNLLRGSRVLNRLELRKLTEIFTRMFHDPHGKVFGMFLETLIDFVAVHRNDLHDWLYVPLTRLLNKMGSDMLGSVQAKVQRALEAVRDSFAYDHQFNMLTRFIIDQTQTPNLKQTKVKVALMNYMDGLIQMMDPADFTNSSDTRLAVSRIITWTTEPKSVDVRKAAQRVLISLFNLNSPEFSMMLSVLPKTFQDGATKILHSHLRTASQESDVLAPRNVSSPSSQSNFRHNRSTPNRNMDDMETENMNPEEIYNSIKKTSADIQNLSKLDGGYDDLKKERDTTSQDSGIQSSMHDIRGESPDGKGSPLIERRYNPAHYQEQVNGYNRAALAEAVFDAEHELFNEDSPPASETSERTTDSTLTAGSARVPKNFQDEVDQFGEILTELSNHNERQEERYQAMLTLIRVTREGAAAELWDEHFKTILLLLLETLGDNDGRIRAMSVRVLREILRHQPERFRDYAELTILKILEAHRDEEKDVMRAAEDCAETLANSINPEQCVRVLNPIVQTAEYPVNLAAIKMQTKVIEIMDGETLRRVLPDVIPGLVIGYDNTESSVRKASVFCLVACYLTLGEELRPFLSELNGSKMKLLNLYIKRAVSQKDSNSASTSKTTSPQSVIDHV